MRNAMTMSWVAGCLALSFAHRVEAAGPGYGLEVRCLESFAATPGPRPEPPYKSDFPRAYRVPTTDRQPLFLLIHPHNVPSRRTTYYFLSYESARFYDYAQTPILVKDGEATVGSDFSYMSTPVVIDLQPAGANALAEPDWSVADSHRYFKISVAGEPEVRGRSLGPVHEVVSPNQGYFTPSEWGRPLVPTALQRVNRDDPAARTGLRGFILQALARAYGPGTAPQGVENACASLLAR